MLDLLWWIVLAQLVDFETDPHGYISPEFPSTTAPHLSLWVGPRMILDNHKIIHNFLFCLGWRSLLPSAHISTPTTALMDDKVTV
jgi:hypothetical protein